MNLKENTEIKAILDRLKKGMIDYISDDTVYTEQDVDICMNILYEYLDGIATSKTKEDGMTFVKHAVLQLNELNGKCEDELIETDQREDICEIITIAGNLLGYNDRGDDITQEWREW